jgi:hypothetical protein
VGIVPPSTAASFPRARFLLRATTCTARADDDKRTHRAVITFRHCRGRDAQRARAEAAEAQGEAPIGIVAT